MNRDPRGFYATLQVTPDATPAEIQRAFRALMRKRHPDVDSSAGAVSDGGDEVRRILEAFTVLRGPQSRAAYDPAATAVRPESARPQSREIPVRVHRARQPVLRVTAVRWERGPE